jgi:Ca-activated chloride channel family protein
MLDGDWSSDVCSSDLASDDPSTDRLPLKATSAKVTISGVIANVVVTQVYKNEGRRTLEAIYLFPGSTRAAVHALRMSVGERVIEAEIQEREKARETYEAAKKEGKTASLLEQQRPNVFQMNVANILPGDEIRVELKYTELIPAEERVYRFVYPAVVGPRYSNKPAAGATGQQAWVENPYLHQGQAPTYSFGLEVDLLAGLDLAKVASPSHAIKTEFSGRRQAHVKIGDDPAAGTKDFILDYQLAGEKVQTGLWLYPGGEENFFLLLAEPPARVAPAEVVPREYIFIVDVSGSMHGFPLDISKALMKEIITGLTERDYFNVLLFSGGSQVLSPQGSLSATAEHKKSAVAWIATQQGAGGTELLPALKTALALPRQEGLSRIVTVITDGYVEVEPEAFELVRKNLGLANLFAFGIGSSVNRFLIEGLARVGQGEPFVLTKPEEAKAGAAKFKAYVAAPVLAQARATCEGFEAYDLEPAALPDLFAARPILLFGKYRGQPQGRIVLTGRSAGGEYRHVVEVKDGLVSAENLALKYLWARSRVAALADLNNLKRSDERIKAVTDLGLKYHLLTAYTSFVAVDKLKRADGQVVTVKQPLPLPAGVSDRAVGGAPPGLAVAPMPPAGGPAGLGRLTSPQPLTEAKAKPEEASSKPKKIGVVRVEVLAAEGLDKAAAAKALEALKADLAACAAKTPAARGELVLTLVLDAQGKVSRVEGAQAQRLDQDTVKCLTEALKKAVLPRPAKEPAKVKLKLALGD